MMNIMKTIFILLLYVFANIGLGQLVSRSIAWLFSSGKRHFPKSDMTISMQFAFGTALISTLWLGLGLAGILYGWLIWAVLLIFAAFAALQLFNADIYSKKTTCHAPFRIVCDYPMYTLLFVLTVILMGWFGVLAYVRPQFGDPGAFYMVYAKIIAATGQIKAMPGAYHDFSAIGLSGELHDAALMMIGTPAMAKFFAWIAGVAFLLILKDIMQRAGGGFIAQVVAVMIVVTSTAFTDYLSDGKTDTFPFLLGLAAIYSVISNSKSTKYSIVITGLLTGFALTAKFSFIIALLPAVLLLLLFKERSHYKTTSGVNSYKDLPAKLILFGIAMGLAILPHLIKNQLLFDNFMAPFYGMKGNWASQSGWFSLPDTLWIIATYPLALVFGLYPLMGGNISVLWLATIPLIIYLPRSSLSFGTVGVQLTLSGFLGVFCWALLQPSVFVPRYFLTAIILLIPLPALAVEYVWQQEMYPRLISSGYALLSFAILLFAPFIPPAGVITALPDKIIDYFDNGRPECGLEISTYCSGFAYLNNKANKGERVFILGYYTYWLNPDFLQCINEPEDGDIFHKYKNNTADLWSAFYEHGFMHIALQKPTHGKYLEILDPLKAPPWLKVSVELLQTDMPVYHLESTDPTMKPGLICATKGGGIWNTVKNN